jgi:MFS family permease
VTDRFGRRNLMLAAMLLYGVGGVVPFALDSFWAVVAGRLLIGVAEAGILTVTNTLLADYYDEERRHRWLMVQGLTGSVLGSLTIAASGFLAAQGWQWPFAVYALAFPIFIAGLVYLYEPEPQDRPNPTATLPTAPAGPFPWGPTLFLCLATMVLSTIYFVQVMNFSVVLKGLGVADPKAIGLIMAVPSIGVPIGSLVFKFTTRFGPTVQIALVLLCYAIGLTGIGLATDYQTAIGFAFVQQLANGIIVPSLIAWAQSRYSFEHRGRGMGLWSAAFFVAQFLSPAVVGLVRHQVGGLQPAFVAFGLLSGACALACVWARWRAAPAATVPLTPHRAS